MQSNMELKSYKEASQTIKMLGSSTGPKSNTCTDVDNMERDQVVISQMLEGRHCPSS